MEAIKDINVWRFNLHTNRDSKKKGHRETFEYCKDKEMLGTGWGPTEHVEQQVRMMSTEEEIIDDDEFENRVKINQKENKYGNRVEFTKSMRALRNMNIDDLIWTRKNHEYYLCRVKEKSKDFMRGERSEEIEKDYDIWHYVPCEFVKIGTEEDVLGAIVKSFNRGVVCHIRGSGAEEIVKEFSKKIYNDLTGTDYYEYKKPEDKWKDFLKIMGPLEVEELVGLYMQIGLGYGIYTSTNKKDTKEYEYILFNRKKPEEKAKLQVKTRDINLEEYNYKDKPFYFYTTGNYKKNGKVLKEEELEKFEKENNAIFIRETQLLAFAKKYEKTGLLPYKLNWFE